MSSSNMFSQLDHEEDEYEKVAKDDNATSVNEDDEEEGCSDLKQLEDAMIEMFDSSKRDVIDDALAYFFVDDNDDINTATFE